MIRIYPAVGLSHQALITSTSLLVAFARQKKFLFTLDKHYDVVVESDYYINVVANTTEGSNERSVIRDV